MVSQKSAGGVPDRQAGGATPGGLVDVHTHAIDPDLPDLSGRFPGVWPSVERLSAGRARVRLGGVPYRDVDERCWSAERRLRDMDADGVEVQLLSPMPATLSHGADPAGAAELSRAQNDFLAGIVSRAPDRFGALGAVPLQDPAAAVAELTRCVRELGFPGVEIGTRAGDLELADEALDPFFVAAAELGALVFVHPVDADVDPRLRRLGLGFGAGMPGETGIAAAGLLTPQVAARRPAVRLCLAHGGGTLPGLLPRMDKGERLRDRDVAEVASDRARSVYCDSLTYDPDGLASAVHRFGPGQVVLGSDYPFPARERPAGAGLAAAADRLPEDQRSAIGRDNALRLLAAIAEARAVPAAHSSTAQS
jgi:aminocarboxymuconate-semialdehyde decarboxylase